MQNLNIYISPCPNDTFVFGPLVNGQIESPYTYDVYMQDIETLNENALTGIPDVIKVSAALYPKLKERYYLLNTGAAMGKGVGPLLVTKDKMDNYQTVALPGQYTTAHFLFDYLFPDFEGEKIEMIFSEIEDAIVQGTVDAGVIIHEGRFTYRDKGLKLIDDLGEMWDTKVAKPLPLGLILVNKDLGMDVVDQLDASLKQSIEYSWENYPELDVFVENNAQELLPETMRNHIELYVNEYTLDLGDSGHEALYHMERLER